MKSPHGATALRVAPGGPLSGTLVVPGDKSITHRALICAALAHGKSVVSGALDAADTRATSDALQTLGARISWQQNTLHIEGADARFTPSEKPLDLGNSGTGLRLLCGALAGSRLALTLTGDASLRRRPMTRITEPLTAMGANIASTHGCAPLTLRPAGSLHGLVYRLPVASAQVKSAVLLAGLGADDETVIEDPFHTRDHTERMLSGFGARLTCDGITTRLIPSQLVATKVEVPGDFSSAAFFIAAALLVPKSRLTLTGVGINPTRIGLLPVLERMGARIAQSNQRAYGAEPVADLYIEGTSLRGVRVEAAEIPSLIDELPVLMVLAAAAEGASVIEGVDELRHKESDRITAMQDGLAALGVEMAVDGDTVHLAGGGFKQGGQVASAGDHRVAMALAVAGLAAPAQVSVIDAGWIATSFPEFSSLLQTAGAQVEAA
ncbi:MAG: 3-phosphoshikimate 1-carboxyvinyltransferase [Gammaproteobacteria bacterium]